MVDGIQIKGGADEFEAAVIAVVLDRIAREEEAAKQGRKSVPNGRFLSAWVRAAAHREDPAMPRESPRPE